MDNNNDDKIIEFEDPEIKELYENLLEEDGDFIVTPSCYNGSSDNCSTSRMGQWIECKY